MLLNSLFVSAAVFLTAVDATSFWVNKGCVIASTGHNGDLEKVCNRQPGTRTINGYVEILACISGRRGDQKANCQFKGTVPANWNHVNFGADNCLYSEGKSPIRVGCAKPITAKPVPDIY